VPMFTRESWEFHGQYYDFEARNVIPKPLQKPHPPLWVACSNIQTIGKAGEWGMGALGFTFVTPEAARAWVHKYYNNLPPTANGLPEGASVLPAGTQQGLNDWRRTGYGGPCPPIGRHRYFHKLYALDTVLPDLGRATKATLEKAMKGHILGQAELVGTYQKRR
jgi:Raf kinase inhibitor-like YbhB/YbcL family protein